MFLLALSGLISEMVIVLFLGYLSFIVGVEWASIVLVLFLYSYIAAFLLEAYDDEEL